MVTWSRATARELGPILASLLAIGVGIAQPQRAHADGEAEAAEKRERCATRLSVTLLGKSASAELFAAPNPQDSVDAMLATGDFHDRFARFVNARFNTEPGETVAEDATYTLAKFILEDGKLPWRQMFVGAYDVTDTVALNEKGLGYFTSTAWMRRYAGSEQDGYRIVAAYQILQNVTGLTLTASTNVEGVDVSAGGRKATACKGCHYDGWFALDTTARVLSRRNTKDDDISFLPATDGPQTLLDGRTITSEKELVEALVASPNFVFNTCRLAFQFLMGRPESSCEGTVFDACVDAFQASGRIQSGIAAIATHPTFCQ